MYNKAEQAKRQEMLMEITRATLDAWHEIIASAALADSEERDRLLNYYNPLVIYMAWPKLSELFWQ